MLFSLILFLGIGIVSASENNTDTGDIENLIDECEDQGSIKLDEKTYEQGNTLISKQIHFH